MIKNLISEIEKITGPNTYEYVISKNDSSNPESGSFRYLSLISSINSVLREQGTAPQKQDIDIMRGLRGISKNINDSYLKSKSEEKAYVPKKTHYKEKKKDSDNGKPISFTVQGPPSEMSTSSDGIERLRMAEGFRAHVYDDHNGKEVSSYSDISKGNPTIGYGHLIRNKERARFEKHLLGRLPMSKEDAELLFVEDVRKHEVPWKNEIKAVLSQRMFDALASYAFNAGGSAPRRYGIIKMLNKSDNLGNLKPDYEGAAEAIRRGPKTSNGILLKGLERRRNREADEFLSGIKDLEVNKLKYSNYFNNKVIKKINKKIRGLGTDVMYKDVDTIKNFGDEDKSEDRKKIETMMADMGIKSLNEMSRKERVRFTKAILGESNSKKERTENIQKSIKKRKEYVTSPFRSNYDYSGTKS